MMDYLAAFGFWVMLVLAAVANGIFRVRYITPQTGELRGHQISSFTLSAVILAVSYIYVLFFGRSGLIEVGFFWLILTVVFEFGFGHYVMKHPWSKLLADYNIFRGRIWVLVLLVTLLGPLLADRFV